MHLCAGSSIPISSDKGASTKGAAAPHTNPARSGAAAASQLPIREEDTPTVGERTERRTRHIHPKDLDLRPARHHDEVLIATRSGASNRAGRARAPPSGIVTLHEHCCS